MYVQGETARAYNNNNNNTHNLNTLSKLMRDACSLYGIKKINAEIHTFEITRTVTS